MASIAWRLRSRPRQHKRLAKMSVEALECRKLLARVVATTAVEPEISPAIVAAAMAESTTSANADNLVITSIRPNVRPGSIPSVSIFFNKSLDARFAQAEGNYNIGVRGPDGTVVGGVPIRSAIYDAATQSVKVVTRRPMRLGFIYRVTVQPAGSPGVTDTQGKLLVGNVNTIPGGRFLAFFGRGTHRRLPNSVLIPRARPIP